MNESSSEVIEIIDVNGRVMRQIVNDDFPEGNHEIKFGRDALIAGIYFLHIKTSEGIIVKKVVTD